MVKIQRFFVFFLNTENLNMVEMIVPNFTEEP